MRKIKNLGLCFALGTLLSALPALAQSPTAQSATAQSATGHGSWAQSPAKTQMAQAGAVKIQPAATVAATPGAAPLPGSAGACLKCHGSEAAVVPILQTPHAVRGDRHSPFGQEACESCHGDSSAHIASRANEPAVVFKGPHISPVKVRNDVCLTCHESGMRMNWEGSAHQVNNKACTDCHTAHVAKDPILVKSTQAEQCFTCHARQRADSFKYSHHPMREGKVVCSDCHNPHGSPVGDEAAEGIQRQRDLLQLPRRQARADAVGTSAGARQLPELPYAARLERTAPVGRADELPLLLLP